MKKREMMICVVVTLSSPSSLTSLYIVFVKYEEEKKDHFLVADTQLFKRPAGCPSVDLSTRTCVCGG